MPRKSDDRDQVGTSPVPQEDDELETAEDDDFEDDDLDDESDDNEEEVDVEE